ncbi:MAG: hypothetical protein WA687_08585 [Solirubrobacterales bacterium]
MQHPISQTPAGLLAIAVATAMVLLLGFATPAGAETMGGLQDAVDTVTEGAATGVSAPAPPPAEVEPEATNVPEVPQPATDVVDDVSETVATATAEPVAAATSQASKLADDVGQRTAEAVEPIVESAGSVASTADDGEDLAAHVVASSQDSLKRAGENLAETGTRLSSTSSALLAKVVLSLSQAVSSVRSATGRVLLATSQEPPTPTAADVRFFSPHPAEGSPSVRPDGKLPVERRLDLLDGLFLRSLVGFGGIAPLHFWASPQSGDFFAGGAQSPSETSAAGAPPRAASGMPANPKPLDSDNPLPPPLESFQAAASGLGGSPSFVPVVGLLALLALAAPATFRRLREMPAFAAPTPFVCALERPG